MRIKRHIPNAITCLNLLSGTLGIVYALQGDIRIAFPLMLAACAFDFLDGFAARLLGAYSDVGKELDSLSDLVSFGVLPAVMLYYLMVRFSAEKTVFCYLPLMIAVFAGLRLAHFNVDDRQHESFIGLAVPSAAMVCGSLTYYVWLNADCALATLCGTWWFLPLVAVILSVLMRSGIPMFALKFFTGHETAWLTKIQRTTYISIVAALIIVVIVCRQNWSLIVLLAILAYILVNLGCWIFGLNDKARSIRQ